MVEHERDRIDHDRLLAWSQASWMLAPKSMPKQASSVTLSGSRRANGAGSSGKTFDDDIPQAPPDIGAQILGWAAAYNEQLAAAEAPKSDDSEDPS